MEFWQQHEGLIRLGVFGGVFATMALWELVRPRRGLAQTRGARWPTNWGLVVVSTLALRFLLPLLAVGAAAIAAERGWGLLNLVGLPVWFAVLAAVVLLDLAIYAQHVLTHRWSLLWRLHKVHHADRDIDVTTGARFHPVEILLSMLYKIVVVVSLGAPAFAVFVFEVLLNASAVFNHANVRLPGWLDRLLRTVIVTPDMHRVHHSVRRDETDSNFGFCLSCWDRLFRTYIAQPRDGHDAMTIGLSSYQDERPASLLWCLLLPFRRLRGEQRADGAEG